MEIEIRSYTGGIAQTNAYLIQRGAQTILIDAPEGVTEWLDSLNVSPSDLLLTHQHYDHIEDAAKLAKSGVKLHAFADYSSDLTLEKFLEAAGRPVHIEAYEVDHLLRDQGELILGDWKFGIEHVPGHAPDSLVFLTENLIFAGDTLFAGSVGRADLPGGDMDLLISGIREKILSLAPDCRVFPGHGPATTVANESQSNPFI